MDIKDLTKDKTRINLAYNKETKEILGEFYTWKKENPNSNIKYTIVEVGYKSRGHYKYNIDAIKELGLWDIHQEMLELHKQKEQAKYSEAKPIAEARLDDMEKALTDIRKKYNCDIGYHIDGDSSGIYEDYLYIDTEVNGISFTRRLYE